MLVVIKYCSAATHFVAIFQRAGEESFEFPAAFFF
jgi:hypothetical protein